eukprot:SAG22_NODE_2039_length_3097_cov_4.879586_4_plen_100_part_00
MIGEQQQNMSAQQLETMKGGATKREPYGITGGGSCDSECPVGIAPGPFFFFFFFFLLVRVGSANSSCVETGGAGDFEDCRPKSGSESCGAGCPADGAAA